MYGLQDTALPESGGTVDPAGGTALPKDLTARGRYSIVRPAPLFRKWKFFPACAVAVLAVCVFFARKEPKFHEVIRVAVIDVPPFQFVENGRYGGFAVDVMNQAAARLGMRLEWVPTTGDVNSLMQSGGADMCTLIGVTKKRREMFFVTQPWLERPYGLLSRSSAPVRTPSEMKGRPVAILGFPSLAEEASRYLADSLRQPYANDRQIVEAVCEGRVDAGFAEIRRVMHALLEPPRVCSETRMDLVPVSGAAAVGTIVANRAFAPEALALRKELEHLLLSGEILAALNALDASSAAELRATFSFEQSTAQRRYLLYALIALFAFSVLAVTTALAARRLWKSSEAARKYELWRSDILSRLAAGEACPAIVSEVEIELKQRLSGCGIEIVTGGRISQCHAEGLRIPIQAGHSLLGEIRIAGRRLSRRGLRELSEFARLCAVILDHGLLHEQLRLEATTDRLTGLSNRHAFAREFISQIDAAAGACCALAVLCIDLDRFKYINDCFGHAAGDVVLAELGRRLRAVCPPRALLARTGGDEFAAVVSGLTPDETEALASDSVEALQKPTFFEGQEIPMSVSIGVSTFPANGSTPEELIRSADLALYRSKELGRNRYSVFSGSRQHRAEERLRVQQLLYRAVEKGRGFEVYYQPQSTPDGGIAGFEALARLRDSEGVFIPPERFIPLAEEMGVIRELGQLVLKTVCEEVAAWIAAMPHIHISVNASPAEVGHPQYGELVISAVSKAGLSPRNLQVELTESTALRAGRHCMANLIRLRNVGFAIALDDFGTGYSSLSRLHKLPVDVIKIDKSFISQSRKNEQDTLYVINAIVAAARALGLRIIAEGVETEAQLRMVRQAGCDLIQGFYFGRPLPRHQAEALLFDSRGRIIPAPPLPLPYEITASSSLASTVWPV
jgi:diguanylate cyclase (GGDEF)-like protein